jgi:hypothetical protein
MESEMFIQILQTRAGKFRCMVDDDKDIRCFPDWRDTLEEAKDDALKHCRWYYPPPLWVRFSDGPAFVD